jgi:hypothetical protein
VQRESKRNTFKKSEKMVFVDFETKIENDLERDTTQVKFLDNL